MDWGKRPSKFLANKNSKIYMDLKDIIRENALPFLPAKCLFRCTSVCREWQLLIRTPFFVHQQSNSFHDFSGFFCQSQSSSAAFFIPLDPMAYGVPDPSLKFLPEPVDIRYSSNGLLCCQGRTGYKAYYICNPVTRKWKMLPKHTSDHGSDPAVVLIFEPSLLNFVAEYKLVCAFPSELDGYEFEIYSSADGSWRVSGEILFGTRKIQPRSGVHVGDIVYWRCGYNIIAFDLKMERSSLLYGSGGALAAMNGKLCSASTRGQVLVINVLSNAYTNTMQMHSEVRTWEERHRIQLDNSGIIAVPNYDPQHENNGVVFISLNGVVVMRSNESLYTHDLKTKSTARVAGEVAANARVFPYVNSLVEI
ncbi:putative F-box protein [Tripterygium wilfordii]|uniref:Putative F-box protein n=1 Tax=Tripterygium wilfordii TaxID=458696 RepID=A0A7J7CQ94_TRIWF|nr:uncharacterized protein LOC120015486 [Tripterygium wilfordii]XP_038723867.1 uncharacterized protein LOC120015486 [Tripterygium wilfordii]KAF5736046.1 putative F-box protein [Tripterygium wilfordii]